ncbi:DUF4878 domain-containing protein [uncultured Prevotella sp.]|uniref:DUF4878 domain-containing protein n=1 Tax=uncultured Prevotella sp. TaxID=159272 RepID=UPI002610F63E|nr:DUF4878 domain-containing protein [uncultured Prevotella sp.]
MKKLIGIMALMAALFIMTSCGGGNSPKSVTDKALKAMLDKDYDTFVEYVYLTPKEGEDIEGSRKMLSGMLQGKAEKTYAKKGGFKSYEILGEQVDEKGENAVVKVKMVYGDGSEKEDDVKLKKDEKGDWKLDMGK